MYNIGKILPSLSQPGSLSYQKMKPQKKSRKLNLIMGVLILLIGVPIGAYLVLNSKIVSTKEGSTGNQDLKNIAALDTDQDTDKDGLEDWQEILFGTDKNNPDTDGDGYLDGEEVLSGHDPLESGTDDKLTERIEGTWLDKDNLTQYFAQQLANQMDSLDSNPDNNLLKISAQDILDSLSSKEITELNELGLNLVPDPISEKELKTIPTSQESVLNYLQEIEIALTKNENIYENADTFKNALKAGNFSEITKIASAYEENYQNIKILAVPKDLSSLHVELLNMLALTKASLENFSQLNQDPVKAYLGLEIYRQVYSSLLPNFAQKLVDQLGLIYKK